MAEGRENRGVDPEALARFLQVTRRLAAPFELPAVLAEIIEAGRALLRADRGTVFLYERETDELVSAVATGVGTLRFPADRGIVGESARTRSVVNVPDCHADPRFNPEGDRRTGYRTRCLLTVPLIGYDESLVGVLQLLNREDGVFDEEDERTATALAAQCAVALQRVEMTRQLVIKERLDRELGLAREIQMGLLPRAVPDLPGYEVAGSSVPAGQTGGDTFDLVPMSGDRLLLLLADATGHGIGPALSVTQVRAMLRIAVRLGADIDDAFRQINDQLAQDLAPGRGVTAFLGLLDARSHEVRYHSGGQAPILHFHAARGEFEWLGPTAMVLGFFEQRKPPVPRTLRLEPGDVLGLITDGVYEAENPSGEALGKDGVEAFLRASLNLPLREVVETLASFALRFASPAPQADDVTVLLLRRHA